MKYPSAINILAAFLLVLGVNGLVGGAMLMIKPDGSLLEMESTWLQGSPFSDYFFPGLLLFIANGVLPMIAFFGLFLKDKWNWLNIINPYQHQHWGWTLSIYAGVVSIVWIIVQQLMTKYFWIQPVVLIMGLVIIIFSLLPRVMNHYHRI